MYHLSDALKAGSLAAARGKGPLLFAEARDSGRWRHIQTAPFYQKMLGELRGRGEQYLAQPISTLPFSQYALFDRTGDRTTYEAAYFDHRFRMNVFAALALCEDGDAPIPALEDAIWAICDEYTWCLPAHFHGESLTAAADPGRMPEGRDQPHSLDLFACETAFALSEILSLLSGRLNGLVAFRARQAVFDRVLGSYMSPALACWWETCDMNWASVCAGSVGAAAMYLIDDDEMLCPLLERVLRTMECYLAGFPEDGACLEGAGYWTYGFGFFTYFAALLRQRTAGRIDLMSHPKARKVALFQQQSVLLGDQVICYADAGQRLRYMPGLTHKLGTIYEGFEIPPAAGMGGVFDECGRWPVLVRNLVWSDEMAAGETLRDAFYFFDHAGIVVSRRVSPAAVAFSAKGGHNDEPHNHNDLGSFILCAVGKSLLVDPGRGQYSRQYFGAGRYDILCNSSRGHSVPVVDGCCQQAGREHEAKVLECRHAGDTDVFTLDLTRAYDCPHLTGLVRGFRFDRAHATLTLCDQYRFAHSPAALVERLVSFQKPEMIGEGHVRLTDGAAGVDICYNSGALRCEIGGESFLTHQSVRRMLYFIDFHVIAPGTAPSVRIVMEAHGC